MIGALIVGGIFGVVLVAVSIWLVMTAISKHKRYRMLVETRMTSIDSLRPGRAKTEGRVRALEEPLVSPMGRRDCVYYHFQVEEQRGAGKHAHWVTVVNDRQSIPFVLEDGRDEVEVDLHRADVEMRNALSTNSSLFSSPPPHLERMLQRRYGTSTHGLLFNKTMKYSETVIEEGDVLVVLGEVRDRGRALTITSGRDTAMLVSDEHPQDLTSKYAWARNGYAIGAGASLLGLLLVILGATALAISETRNRQPQPAFNPPPRNFPPPQPPQPPQPPFGQVDKQKLPPQPELAFVEQAVQDLRSNNLATRRAAASRLSRAPDDARQREDFQAALADDARHREIANLLVELMRTDPTDRSSAASALRLWIVPDVVPDVVAELEKATKNPRDPRATLEGRSLVEALGKSKDLRAVPVLLKQLWNSRLRSETCEALESIGPDATGALVEALADDKSNRSAICGVLEKIGTAEALPALEKLRKHDDLVVASAAKSAEEQIRKRTKKD